MKNRALTAAAAGLAIVAAFAVDIVKADEIKVLCTIGVKPALPEVVAEFERTTGHKVSIAWGNAATLKTRYLEGEPADVAVLTAAAIDDLAKAGKVTGGRVDLARSGEVIDRGSGEHGNVRRLALEVAGLERRRVAPGDRHLVPGGALELRNHLGQRRLHADG